MRAPDVVLIGNYVPDRQESMQRFALGLQRDLGRAGVRTWLWRPPALLGRGGPSFMRGVGKWLGYVDKFVLFVPLLLLGRAWAAARRSPTVFHVCDHSNAPYLRWLPPARSVITCHDVIAIRGARGDADAHVGSTRLGEVLQAWIFRHLAASRWLISVSQATLTQLQELAADEGEGARRVVVGNGLNASFDPMVDPHRSAVLSSIGVDPDEPFILHVGSDLPRKNRVLLLDLAADAVNPWPGLICFAGAPVGADLHERALELGLAGRVIGVPGATHEQLVALYSGCAVFVFPSLSEGFGWPVIEAQACGAPVVASDVAPMPEVGGVGAVYADPTRPDAFAAAVAALSDTDRAAEARRQGMANIRRFDNTIVTAEHVDLYREMIRS